MSNLSSRGTLRGSVGAGGGSSPQDVYWDDILDKPEFAAVATSGSYNDLTDKPTPPTVMVGATAQSNGAAGYAPQPLAGDQNKFLNGGGEWVMPPSSSVNYSTNEQVIGTWIDGKPLYQKTIVTNNSTINTDVILSVIDLNIDTLVSIVGGYKRIATWANLEFMYHFNCYENEQYNSYLRYSITNNEIQYSIRLGTDETTNYQIFTLQYTKTTDTLGGE